MKPKRIQRKRTKGWRMSPNTIYVGRPSRWGNPFQHGDAIEAYRAFITLDYKWFRQHSGYSYTAAVHYPLMSKPKEHPAFIRELLDPLRGKDLACWCKEGAPCHADILLELANQ